MKSLEIFKQFAKGSPEVNILSGGNCVIYTRVSSKEQTKGYSLENQLEICERYADRKGYEVVKYFGGTYESAQSDERKEFGRMLSFVRNQKNAVTAIVVYNFDRFSRTGENSTYLVAKLREKRIALESATQPTDTFTPGGELQQSIYLAFAKYDNSLRRDRIVEGMTQKLKNGYWVSQPPIGYDSIKEGGERKIVPNATGKLIRKAFLWKANEALSGQEIISRLRKLGFKTYAQQLNRILNNPFYCGLITHGLLKGEIVEGKHKALVSQEIFLRANDIRLKVRPTTWTHAEASPETPLKRSLLCSCCGNPLTSYSRKTKRKRGKNGEMTTYTFPSPLYYYKCNTKGCKVNLSATKLHRAFIETLRGLQLPHYLKTLARQALIAKWEEINGDRADTNQDLSRKIKGIDKKIKEAQNRLFDGAIPLEVYDQFVPPLKEDKAILEHELQSHSRKISNPEKFIDKSLEIAENLAELWEKGNYHDRKKLQKLAFPEGVSWHPQNHHYRTHHLNSIFRLFSTLKPETKRGLKLCYEQQSSLVAPRGIEPLFKV